MLSRRLPASGTSLLVALLFAAPAWSQAVISAHSGVIHYVEGDVTIDGELTQPKFAQFPEVKPGQVLATKEGRVEMLLTPGVFLRLAENSSVKMISNALANTRLEVASGAALIEVGELLSGNSITVLVGSTEIALPKKGLYRLEADPARLRVYDGQAQVVSSDKKITAKKGREVQLDSEALEAKSFDTKENDAFYRWSGRRAGYIAAANVTSAHVASNSGYGSGFFSGRSAWSWNPYFGMFTYLPSSGIYQSPFGSPFYSPSTIRFIYAPRSSSSGYGFGYGGSGPASIGRTAGQPSMRPAPSGTASGAATPRLGGSGIHPSGGMSAPRSMSTGTRGR